MHWAEGFIAVDWGTTNRRAYRIAPGGECVAEFEDSRGAATVERGAFPAAVAEIGERLGDGPLLLAGMVGSTRGWVEAPYVSCPASLEDLAGSLVWPQPDVAIVPGVALRDPAHADVMRGEEVQLLGAVAEGVVPGDSLVCHPGTHNKWSTLAGGRIESFRTVMTGELFNLLKQHSILADLLVAEAAPDDAFRFGVHRALDRGDVQAELFAVRARALLGFGDPSEASSYVSGLLIGGDVAIGLAGGGQQAAVVMGRPELTALYAAALAEAGREARCVDGERCFLAGARRIAERIA